MSVDEEGEDKEAEAEADGAVSEKVEDERSGPASLMERVTSGAGDEQEGADAHEAIE